ncbi:MAG: filamentous hemagglutinin N-terminal domain-containing protein [Myxococcota bacterium]
MRIAPMLALAFLLPLDFARAQVVFDDSLGTPGAAPLDPGGTTYLIEADRGASVASGGRSHLFFSFERFDVPVSETAEFRPGADIDTIVSRVTGGGASRIDGGLRVETLGGGAGPDLFLLNPDGVLFGGTTRLDLGGSLHVSTASGLGFADGSFFSAVDPGAPLPASAAAPSLLRFDGSQAGDIAIEGRVFSNDAGGARDAAGVSFVAREISATGPGSLAPEQATLQLGAVGTRAIDVPLDLRAADLGRGSASGGSIRIDAGSSAAFNVTTLSPNPDQGRIVIRGGALVLQDGSLIAGGDGSPGARAIDVDVAGTVSLSGSSAKIESQSGASVGAGGVRISADRLELGEAASVEITTNRGSADAGRLEIAVDALEIAGQFSELRSSTRTAGAGGAIDVEARTIRLRDEGRILSESLENPSVDVGPNGSITLVADRIDLANDADVLSVTNDAGAGGDVLLRSDSLSLVERSRIGAGSNADAPGGDVRIEAGRLTLASSSVIGTGPLPVGPVGETRPAGPAGSLIVVADSARIEGGSQLSTTTIGSGDAGDLQVDVRDTLVLTGELEGEDQPSGLFARSGEIFGAPATGDGGRIVVRAGRLEVSNGAQINATTVGSGRAGEIDVATVRDLVVDGDRSRISTFSADTGATGSLRLEAGRDLVLRGGAEITSEAPIPALPGAPGDPPTAGGIELVAGELLRIEDARVATDSVRPESGDISLSAGDAIGIVASEITTNVDSVAGRGGDVAIETRALALASATITANAAGANADAGDLTLVAREAILQSPDSRIEARAELGVAGEIVRAAPETNLAEELGRLAAEIPSEATALLDPCEARRSSAGSVSRQAPPLAGDSPEALLPLAPASTGGDDGAGDGCPTR